MVGQMGNEGVRAPPGECELLDVVVPPSIVEF